MRRVLVTGSRSWTERGILGDALREQVAQHGPIIVVHGDCPTGADAIAKGYARYLGQMQEPFPADWKRYGRVAGPIRNQQMVDAGADICLAFPLGKSVGTNDCIRRAETAGIPVFVYPKEVPL